MQTDAYSPLQLPHDSLGGAIAWNEWGDMEVGSSSCWFMLWCGLSNKWHGTVNPGKKGTSMSRMNKANTCCSGGWGIGGWGCTWVASLMSLIEMAWSPCVSSLSYRGSLLLFAYLGYGKHPSTCRAPTRHHDSPFFN